MEGAKQCRVPFCQLGSFDTDWQGLGILAPKYISREVVTADISTVGLGPEPAGCTLGPRPFPVASESPSVPELGSEASASPQRPLPH